MREFCVNVTITTESSTIGATTLCRMNFSGFVWEVTTFDYIWLNSYYCMLCSSRIRVRIRFSVVLVSGYAHIFVLYLLLSSSRYWVLRALWAEQVWRKSGFWSLWRCADGSCVVCFKLHLRDRRTDGLMDEEMRRVSSSVRPSVCLFVRCVCHGRPSYRGINRNASIKKQI